MLRLMGLDRHVRTHAGSNVALVDASAPRRSVGARALVAEAMRTDTDLPLFATFGAGLTELASAYLMEPAIAERLTAVWISGSEHPGLAEAPPGSEGIEYDLNIDVAAAQVVFDSRIPLWQVPRNAYRQCLVSMTELLRQVRPQGRVGRHLYDSVFDVFGLAAQFGLDLGETYILGDDPLVLLTALQSSFQPDPSSSRYVAMPAPRTTDEGTYALRDDGRQIPVYTELDVRLMVDDLYDELALRHPRGRAGAAWPSGSGTRRLRGARCRRCWTCCRSRPPRGPGPAMIHVVELRTSIDVAVPPDRVFGVLVDVERWPEWTGSVSRVRSLDAGPLAVGSRVELSQPRIPTGTYTVTALEPGRAFTWEQRQPGSTVAAHHECAPLPDGSTRVELRVVMGGVVGGVVGRLYRRLTERYLAMEAAGLKLRAESLAR